MQRRTCWWTFFLGFLLTPPATSQNLSPEDPTVAIQEAFGGALGLERLSRLEILGALDAERPLEFRLRIAGSLSRFDTEGISRFERGPWQQLLVAGRGGAAEREVPPGWELMRLLPYGVVRDLGRTLKYQGRESGLDWFAGRLPQTGFLGYDPPPAEVEAAVDPATRLPVRLQVHVPDLDRDVEILWEDYRWIDGVPVPATIRRRVGRQHEEVWRIRAVTLDPVFRDDELTAPEGGQ